MDYKYFEEIDAISLVCACGCNLNCKYCLLDQSIQGDASKNLQKITIEALKNGTYLDNIKKIFNKSKISTTRIKYLSIWGQEPLLILQYFNNAIDEWYNTFPNTEQFRFSSNMMANVDDLLQFILLTDAKIKHPILLDLQISYDGEYSTNNIRGASSTQIAKNLKYLIENLNNHKLKNVHLILNIHSVVPLELIKHFNSIKKIKEYLKELDEFCYNFCSINTNPSVETHEAAATAFEMPTFATVEDGILLQDFIRKSEMINTTDFHKPCNIILGALTSFKRGAENFKSKLDILSSPNLISTDIKNKRSNNRYPFCGTNTGELKIMYDGTLVGCQNWMFVLDENNIPDDGSIDSKVKQAVTKQNYNINPLIVAEDIVEENFYLFKIEKNDSFLFIYQQILNLMFLLLKAGQISPIYRTDREKFMRHAFYIASATVCSYNNLVTTGSALVTNAGMIKLLCNGAFDILDNLEEDKNDSAIHK